jgi:hypothetical protein
VALVVPACSQGMTSADIFTQRELRRILALMIGLMGRGLGLTSDELTCCGVGSKRGQM